MEFMARVPASLKLQGGESKHLLKSSLRGILPDAVLDRPKMGFGAPLAEWMRGSLKEMLVDSVLSDRAQTRGYFKREAVRNMARTHMSGSNEFQYVIWDMLMLERSHPIFIDQRAMVRAAANPVTLARS